MILQLFRVKQWIKNGFIILPLIFSGRFLDISLWFITLKTFLAFSLITSVFYIINDIIDRKADRLHPIKSKRPIAAGKISPQKSIGYALLSALSAFFFLRTLNSLTWITIGIYIILQFIYNLFTKHWVILDVITIALGFLLRIWIGALAIGIIPSMWLQLCVLALALFLGFTKRRHELSILKKNASIHRLALSEYTLRFLDQMTIICSTLAIVFYGLYTISSDITYSIGHSGLLYSICFVVYGIFRYLYLVHVKKLGDDPGEILLRDGPSMINALAWLFFIIIILLQAISHNQTIF